jgi:hypothetical protein
VLAEDETHLDLLARVRSCWTPLGMRHRVMTPGSNVRRTVHGAVNLATGAFHCHLSVKNVSVVFCYFLDLLLAACPNAPVVAVICDNGTTHHSCWTSSGSATAWSTCVTASRTAHSGCSCRQRTHRDCAQLFTGAVNYRCICRTLLDLSAVVALCERLIRRGTLP